MASMSEPVLGVNRAMARYGWRCGGIARGFICVYTSVFIARIAPPEHRLVKERYPLQMRACEGHRVLNWYATLYWRGGYLV